jgi:hypothetical protein
MLTAVKSLAFDRISTIDDPSEALERSNGLTLRFIALRLQAPGFSITSVTSRAAAGTINCRGNPEKPSIRPGRGRAAR